MAYEKSKQIPLAEFLQLTPTNETDLMATLTMDGDTVLPQPVNAEPMLIKGPVLDRKLVFGNTGITINLMGVIDPSRPMWWDFHFGPEGIASPTGDKAKSKVFIGALYKGLLELVKLLDKIDPENKLQIKMGGKASNRSFINTLERTLTTDVVEADSVATAQIPNKIDLQVLRSRPDIIAAMEESAKLADGGEVYPWYAVYREIVEGMKG